MPKVNLKRKLDEIGVKSVPEFVKTFVPEKILMKNLTHEKRRELFDMIDDWYYTILDKKMKLPEKERKRNEM